jgi:hypothetical protein
LSSFTDPGIDSISFNCIGTNAAKEKLIFPEKNSKGFDEGLTA